MATKKVISGPSKKVVKKRSKTKVLPPANLPVVASAGAALSADVITAAQTAAYPNTTSIHIPFEMAAEMPNTEVIKPQINEDRSIIKSPRAAFYLGLITGVVIMSLLVVIAYYAALTDTYYLSQAYPAGPTIVR